jgi:hypothetical protein
LDKKENFELSYQLQSTNLSKICNLVSRHSAI